MRQDGKTKEDRPGDIVRFLQTLIIIFAVGLGVTVAVGLRGVLSEGGGFTSWLVPIVFAAVLSVLLAGLWHVTLRMTNRINPRNTSDVWTVIGFGLALTAGHAATSMPFLASAIGGWQAQRHHEALAINDLLAELDHIAGAREMQRQFQNGLSQESTQLQTLLTQEIAGEGPSGEQGVGPVAGVIQAALNALTDADRSMYGDERVFNMELAAIRADISRAREVSQAGEAERFAAYVGQIHSDLVALKARANQIVTPGYDFAGSSIPEIRTIGESLGQLRRIADATTPTAGALGYEPISRPVAVLRHPEVVPLAWSVAIAADFLPLAAMLLLILRRRVERRG